MPRDFLTTGEVAAMLRVRPGTVRKWSDEGRLPGYIPGGGKQLRFTLVQVTRFAQEHGLPIDGLISEATADRGE